MASLALAALNALSGTRVLVFDTQMRYVLVAGGPASDPSFSSSFVKGRLASEVLCAERWAVYEPLYRAALRGETHSGDFSSPDGECWYSVQVGPLRAGDGEVVGGVSHAAEITQRKDAERQLLAMVDRVSDGSVLVDGEGLIVRVNSRMEVLFGYASGELIGRPVETLIPERFRDAHASHRGRFSGSPQARVMSSGLGHGLAGRRKDGSGFPIDVSLSPIEVGRRSMVVSAIRDLTAPKRNEAEQLRLASIVAGAPVAIVSLDMQGRVTTCNDAAEALLGYSAEEAVGRDVSFLIPESERREGGTPRDSALAGKTVEQVETERVHKDGTLIDVSVSVFPLFDVEGRQTGAAEFLHDIGDRRRQARQLVASEQRYSEILAHTPDGVMRLNDANRIDYVNARMSEMLGYSAQEMLGLHPGDLIDPAERHTTEQNIEQDSSHLAGRVVERRVRRKDGRTCYARISTASLSNDEGSYAGSLAIWSDITEAKNREAELRSSEAFIAAVADSMAEGMFAIDGASCLTYMNPAAEQMLGWTEAELMGRSMHKSVHVVNDGSTHPVERCPLVKVTHTGIPESVDDDVFLQRDGKLLPVAYSSAPVVSAGRSGAVVVFRDISASKSEQLRVARELEALTWVGRIRDALDEDRFVLYAQPIVELSSGAVTQHELLIRMVDRDGEVILPNRFLPAAERFGLIEEIDRWVIDEATRLVGEGHAVAMQFNLSGKSLAHADLADKIHSALLKHGADPARLVCEITETALLENAALGETFVGEVNALGCKVALDDFGTGYGGFTYLKRLPVDYLKIDIEFVRDLVENSASQHVVSAIVSLARGFGQKTIAEGVEDENTLELLKEMGVDYVQGYVIGRPAPATETLQPGVARTRQ